MLGTLFLTILAVRVYGQVPSSTALPESGGGSTASAADLSALPACAQTCLGNSTTAQGSCASEDIKCLCGNTHYVSVLSCCIATQCNSDDQDSSASFNTQLCTSVNVTLPNYLGCSNGDNGVPGNASVPSSTNPGGLVTSGTAQSANETATSASTIAGTLESQISLITTAAVATFTGGTLMNGSCSRPQFASMTLPAGGILEYPWLGCSEEEPGCCPFNIRTGGKLSVCPADYITTSSACCPSGWSIYTSAFAGETPCVSSPSLPLVAPSTIAPPGASVSAITDQLFTFKYALVPKHSSKLATGAIAGIAVGSAGAFALSISAITLLIRHRRAKARAEREAATVSQSETAVKGRTELDPSSPHDDTKAVSELPTPHSPQLPERPVWSFRLPTSPSETGNKQVFEMPAAPPAEMAGDTFMDEHHPLGHMPGASGSNLAEKKRHGLVMEKGDGVGDGEGDEGGPVSPEEEEATPAYTPTSGKMLSPADEPYVGSTATDGEEVKEEEAAGKEEEEDPVPNRFD